MNERVERFRRAVERHRDWNFVLLQALARADRAQERGDHENLRRCRKIAVAALLHFGDGESDQTRGEILYLADKTLEMWGLPSVHDGGLLIQVTQAEMEQMRLMRSTLQ